MRIGNELFRHCVSCSLQQPGIPACYFPVRFSVSSTGLSFMEVIDPSPRASHARHSKSTKSCGYFMFDGEHVASRINVPLFSPSSDTQTLSPVCSGVALAFPRNSSFARVRKLTLSLFRNATSDVASKGHLCEYCCMPRKYCRYGFSAISFTSARSDSFLRFWIMRAPKRHPQRFRRVTFVGGKQTGVHFFKCAPVDSC